MSYVRFDDQHENGRLSEFCARLSGEVRMHTGERFHIFQDRNDIAWGENWKRRVEESIDAVTFLMPIVTPSFLKSSACRAELEQFFGREQRLGRDDLILPVYYLNCPALTDEKSLDSDRFIKVLASRQYADWRELRFEPLASPSVGKTIARMAAQIVEALGRSGSANSRPSADSGNTNSVEVGSGRTENAGQPRGSSDRSKRRADPPTHVVDAMHRGDFSKLADALAAAKPGDKILVRPGLYKEGLVLDKPVEIIGDGERSEIVIEATGADVILFQANMGRVANLTLRQNGGGKWYCVDISQGRLDLEGCDITSRSLACIAVRDGADPRVRRNYIHGGQSHGVYVYDGGLGTLEDNEMCGTGLSCVAVARGGDPTFRRNRIHGSAQGGVYLFKDGRGTFEDNDIFGNELANVEIADSSNPVLRGNRIYDGRASGVFVHDGKGLLEENDIFGNAMSGVVVKGAGIVSVRRNRVHDNRSHGAYVHDGGNGLFEDNEILANGLSNIAIGAKSNPTFRRNRICNSKQSGISIFSVGQGLFEENDISDNAHAGVFVREGKPVVRHNRINKNGYEGVWIAEGGEGNFVRNDLRENGRGAWDITESSKDKILKTDNIEQ